MNNTEHRHFTFEEIEIYMGESAPPEDYIKFHNEFEACLKTCPSCQERFRTYSFLYSLTNTVLGEELGEDDISVIEPHIGVKSLVIRLFFGRDAFIFGSIGKFINSNIVIKPSFALPGRAMEQSSDADIINITCDKFMNYEYFKFNIPSPVKQKVTFILPGKYSDNNICTLLLCHEENEILKSYPMKINMAGEMQATVDSLPDGNYAGTVAITDRDKMQMASDKLTQPENINKKA